MNWSVNKVKAEAIMFGEHLPNFLNLKKRMQLMTNAEFADVVSPEPVTMTSYEPQKVIVTDFSIPFGNLVWLMLKICFATVPVVIIIGLVYVIFFGMLVGMATSPG